MASLGGSDEDEVEQQMAASEPMVQEGGAALGNRGMKDAAPLIKHRRHGATHESR